MAGVILLVEDLYISGIFAIGEHVEHMGDFFYKKVVSTADDLRKRGMLTEEFYLLEHVVKNSTPEVCWRYCRACRNKGRKN